MVSDASPTAAAASAAPAQAAAGRCRRSNVGPVDFDHLDLVAAQVPGQAGAIRDGAFDAVGAGNSVRP
jgi:hypothetical protein